METSAFFYILPPIWITPHPPPPTFLQGNIAHLPVYDFLKISASQ